MLHSVLLDREIAARRCGNLAGYGFHSNPSASTTLNAPFEQWLLEKVPPRILETPFPVSALQSFDKIFASQWLDPKTIVTGSKDNKLLVWDLSGPKPTYQSIPIPRSSDTPIAENCGIHSVAKNQTNSLLVTGASNPCDLAVFSLPDFKHVATLVGHTDWSFACDFLSENQVISVSRDKHFAVWTIDASDYDGATPVASEKEFKRPAVTVLAHDAKIRDMKTGRNTNTFATLGADGDVKIWDSTSLQALLKIDLEDDKELVCLEYDDVQHMAVVGSLEGTTIYDTRSGDCILGLAAYDVQWGVRSVNLRQHLLASGGGFGSIGFFDIRKGVSDTGFVKLMNCGNKDSCVVSEGYLDKKSSFYSNYIANSSSRYAPAVYTLQWDPTGTRLFAAGGPIMLGLKGCYAALF